MLLAARNRPIPPARASASPIEERCELHGSEPSERTRSGRRKSRNPVFIPGSNRAYLLRSSTPHPPHSLAELHFIFGCESAARSAGSKLLLSPNGFGEIISDNSSGDGETIS